MNWFLKLKVFRLLSKISYALCIVHTIVFAILFTNGNELHIASLYTWVNHSVILLIVSVIVTIILNIVVESPFLILEKRYLAR